MKCETPAFASVSSREPAPIQKPSATERTDGTRSEITRSPESSSERTYFCTGRSYSAVGVAKSRRRGTKSPAHACLSPSGGLPPRADGRGLGLGSHRSVGRAVLDACRRRRVSGLPVGGFTSEETRGLVRERLAAPVRVRARRADVEGDGRAARRGRCRRRRGRGGAATRPGGRRGRGGRGRRASGARPLLRDPRPHVRASAAERRASSGSTRSSSR